MLECGLAGVRQRHTLAGDRTLVATVLTGESGDFSAFACTVHVKISDDPGEQRQRLCRHSVPAHAVTRRLIANFMAMTYIAGERA